MDATTGTFIAGIAAAVLTLIGAILAHVYTRLSKIEDRERECQKDLFTLRTEMQTVVLVNDFFLMRYPEADEEVRKLLERIAKRKDIHKTQG